MWARLRGPPVDRRVDNRGCRCPDRSTEIGPADIVLPSEGAQPGTGGGAGDAFFSVTLDRQGAPPSLHAVERAYVGRVVAHCDGHRTSAAAALGISYPTFLKRLRELGLD